MGMDSLEQKLKDLVFTVESETRAIGKAGIIGNPKYQSGPSVADVAVVQEFGSPSRGIPPRSFMRTTMVEKNAEFRSIAEKGAKAIVEGRATGAQVMGMLSVTAAGGIKDKITSIMSPPLSPKTIAARLRRRTDKKNVGNLTKPLIDTGLLLSSIQSAVEEG